MLSNFTTKLKNWNGEIFRYVFKQRKKHMLLRIEAVEKKLELSRLIRFEDLFESLKGELELFLEREELISF